MERRPNIPVIIALVVTLLFGIAIGGVVGGGAAYYLTRKAPAQAAAQPLAQPISSVEQAPQPTMAPATPQPSAPLPAPGDTSVVAVVKQVSPAVVTVINTLKPDAVPNDAQQFPLPFPGQQPDRPQRSGRSADLLVLLPTEQLH